MKGFNVDIAGVWLDATAATRGCGGIELSRFNRGERDNAPRNITPSGLAVAMKPSA